MGRLYFRTNCISASHTSLNRCICSITLTPTSTPLTIRVCDQQQNTTSCTIFWVQHQSISLHQRWKVLSCSPPECPLLTEEKSLSIYQMAVRSPVRMSYLLTGRIFQISMKTCKVNESRLSVLRICPLKSLH